MLFPQVERSNDISYFEVRYLVIYIGARGQAVSSVIFPMTRIVPDSRSRITKMSGRSILIGGGAQVTPTPTLVAAAASVRSSFTSTKVFWITFVMISSLPRGDIGVRSEERRVGKERRAGRVR